MSAVSDEKTLALRREDACRECGTSLAVGTRARYRRSDRTVACLECVAPAPSAPTPDPGIPGASARAEHERRRANRERRTREAHPRIGGLMLALQEAPQSERAWAKGSEGEERVAARLAKLCRETPVRFLHDRRIPGSRGNIDHLAIAPSGVHVIDPKNYTGKVEVRVSGGILRARVETLWVHGRNRTKLVEGIERQVDVVRSALGDAAAATVPVHAALCFVDNDLPLTRKLSVRDVAVLTPKRVAKRLKAAGPLDQAAIDELYAALAVALPPAA